MMTRHAGQRVFLGFLFGKLLCQQFLPFKSKGNDYTAQGLGRSNACLPPNKYYILLGWGMLSGQSSVKHDEAQL